jgi:CHAT domain-containing protein
LLKEIPDTEKLNYKGLPWLIRNHAISYSSSATIYFEQSSQAEKDLTSRNLIAFAPSYNYVRTVRNGTEDDTLAFNLLPILGTEEEVKSISEIYKTRRLFDSRASEENFKKMAPDYRILHLAMHTVIDNQQPLYSKLVFTKPDKSSPEDGYLNTFELFNLRLRGELAVLSACNTGTGKLERGEGIISLARGFFYSGIPSVVMTLWEIEDHSSADLMEMFYRNLKKGLEKDIALQQAKIDYLDQTDHLHAHPYFWAGFVSIGKTTPISSVSSPFRSNALIYSVISLLLITFGIFVIRKRVYFHKKRH